ncbi:MAG: hypothetical protein WBE37_27175, partial [Bryobacteraceae bacterium]
MKIGQGMRRPRSGRLPFFGFGFQRENGGYGRERSWESGKPAFGFPRFPRARHFHGPPLAELRQGRRLALPKQLGLGRAHPASA